MAEILAPRFELFRRVARALTKTDQRVTKAVRIEIRQTGRSESLLEDTADRTRIHPVVAREPGNVEAALVIRFDFRSRKDRIVVAPQALLHQEVDPFLNNPSRRPATGEEGREDGLTVLRLHLARVLVHSRLAEIEVFDFQGSEGAIANPVSQVKAIKRSIPALDVGSAGMDSARRARSAQALGIFRSLRGLGDALILLRQAESNQRRSSEYGCGSPAARASHMMNARITPRVCEIVALLSGSLVRTAVASSSRRRNAIACST